ncbi:uncharacterized protein LOC143288833 [Babylonia areolata]|uniref:uncharacterized protein LOC143288833 n=1 Tax=Babylonia areolata TaxID=304850 RepID=UPI003FD397E5
MVVVGCFGMHVLVVGGVKSFGVLFVELQQLYGVSARQLGIVHGLASVLMMALGPVSNALSVRFSCRSVVFVGGVLIGCGFVSSAFVPSFTWLYLTYSILTGLGSALAYAPSVVMVGHHFLKRRALANGISVSGSALGSFLLPNLMRSLLNHYGLRGAMATIGAVMFHVCACAALFRPLTSYRRPARRHAATGGGSLHEESASVCLPLDESVRTFQPAGGEEVAPCPSPREDSCKLSPLDDEIVEQNVFVPDNLEEMSDKVEEVSDKVEEMSDKVEDSDGGHLELSADKESHVDTSPTPPDSPGFDPMNGTSVQRSPDLRKLADINSPRLERKAPDVSHSCKLQRLGAFDRSQTVDSEVDGQDRPGVQKKHHAERSPDLRREQSPVLNRMDLPDTSPSLDHVKTPPHSPTLGEGEETPRSPNPSRMREAKKSPNLGRVGELRRNPNLGRQEVFSRSEGNSPSQSRRNGPVSVPSADAVVQNDAITASTIRDSLEKKLARNASVSSMIAHFGSMKQAHRGQERTGSFKLNFRRDSSKCKTSGSLKRRAFQGGKPILERHPSALWDARVPESLKQAIEEEKRGPQKGDSIELSLLQRDSNQDLVGAASLARSGSKTERTNTINKRIGSFKAIDAAKPIRFIERKKLLLANNLRYRSETRDAGVATPTLVANEKVPLKRFYSVETGHHHTSPVLQESFLHRRIRQISQAESWRSESSVFASAGDLALASLQNISVSATEADDDVFSTASRTSGLKSLLRLSAQTVYKGERKKSVPLFELSLMLNPVFLVFFLSLVCMNFGYPNIFVMLPSYCQHEVGMDKTTAAFVASVIGLTDLVGRLFIGWFSDLRLFPRKYGFVVSLTLAGVLCTLLPKMKNYHGLVAFACGFGFCGGCFIALIAVILVDFLGKERLASSFGLASVAMAVGIMAGPAIYGDIRDTTGSWDSAFVVAGLMSLAAASCIFIQPLAQHVLNRPIKSGDREVRDEML